MDFGGGGINITSVKDFTQHSLIHHLKIKTAPRPADENTGKSNGAEWINRK